jgi:hypothetical protein
MDKDENRIELNNQHKTNEPKKPPVFRKSDLLLPPTLDTKGWKFDREEANER